MQRWIQTLKPTWWSGLGMLVLALGAGGHAMAATITVDTLGDGNTGCTLRRALANANAANQGATECTRGDSGGNEIRFNTATQVIVLTAGNGPLVIERSLTITGNGAASTSISGGGLVRVLDIPVGSSVILALNGLTVSNGKALASSTMSNAGGLFIPAGSTANLSNCAFRSNDAQSSGGAIENRGALTINACTFTGNTAAGEGGAIRNIGTMTVDGSIFNGNTADRGGAVWVNRTAVTNIDLLNSKFGANTGGSIGGAVVLGTAVMNATGSSATLTTTGSVSNASAYPESPPTITVQPTTPVTVGSAATLSVTLTGSTTPTGTVSLLSGVDAIAGCSNLNLTNGAASCSPTTLVVGMHTITAQYSGDSNYLPGTSAGVAQVIDGSTNVDTKQVTVSGPQNAEVWVDSANKGTLTATGKLTVALDTPAPDGAKPFVVETKTAGGGSTLVTGTLTITRDGTPPVFSALQPADGGLLGSSSTIDYTLSEDVEAGATIVFTRTGGAADPTPHTCTLQGTALNAGSHQIAYAANANGCSTALNLVSNAIYSIAFSGTDKAGNPSATAPVTGVTYDTTLPTATLTLPTTSTSRTITVAAGAFSGSDTGSGIAAAGYCLQESNVSANCAWGAVPTSYPFASDGNKTLYGFVKDNAGNVSAVAPAATASVLVDSSVPVAPTLATTPTYAIGNSTALTIQSAENGLQVWLGNSNTGQVIAGGTASISIDTSGIANGQQATFRITLRDAAGNVSAELVLPLTRDTSAPVFSATTPANNAAIKANATLGFTLSKPVASALITATRTGGAADGSSPHTCNLQGIALHAGANRVALTADANGCMAPLGLVDGAIYTFAFDATDAASNPAVTASITGVTYDTSAPAAPAVTTPANNASAEGSSVVISGTAEAGSRVDVYEGATLLGSGTATGGNFSVTVSGLAFVVHNFTLKATDAAGNESASSPVLTYTAQVPSGGGGSTPPAVVTQGSVAVTPGTPVTVGGSVQVTASPGSTITLNPQSGGSTITLPPAGSGGTPAPVTLVIGGQTFSIQPQADTATVLSVVTLIGANGQPQVALVLNPSTSGDSQVTLSGTVSQGTVVALLSTSTGNLPLTAQGDGVVSVTLITTPRAAAGTPQSWSVFVRTGRVALPPAANGAAAVTVYSGEMARLDGTGKVQSVRLGTVAGNGLGDPVQRTDLPAGINANVGFVRLAGVPTRTGGSAPLETLVHNGLRTVGITSSPQSSDGSVTWTLGGVSFPVVPLEVRVVPGRADGASVAEDGSIEVATAGLVTRFGPALQSLPAMGQALTALGATTVMQPNGALRVSLGTTVFHMRAQWLPMGRTGNAPGFVFSSTAGLVFTDASGVSQALQGDVADYDGLTSLLQSVLGTTTILRTGLDLQTELTLGSQRFLLVPDLALLPAGTGPANSNWWFEGAKLFVRYPGGLVQGFAVTAR
ncbi:MAG: Ig-like domain repeat protein [Acidovorax sp.]|nr:Ig-like domain repeat protein [Acidovorax sp.]MDZ7864796.1 Ig-like domain repeat protein [Acidovorax sp.]